MAYQSPSASNPSLTTSAYMVPDPSTADNNAAYSSDEDEIASLPSESTTSSELGTLSDDYSDAEEEWRESIEQLELLLLAGAVELTWGGGVLDIGARRVSVSPLRPQR